MDVDRNDSISDSRRSNPATVVAMAFVAYASCDVVHEALGHGVASVLAGVQVLRLSSIGLQTATSSRFVASAGSIANVVAGLAATGFLARQSSFGPGTYFAWLF